MEQDGKSMAQEESNRGNKEWNPERKDANLDNEALIKEIVQTEWAMFDRVSNAGGRAGCQDDWETFDIMRRSQFVVWDRVSLESYRNDLQQAEKQGRNLLTEKYAYMMQDTCPEEYQKIEKELPVLSAEKQKLVSELTELQTRWMERFHESHPLFGSQGRSVRKKDAYPGEASVETYAMGELSTYSEKTLACLKACYETLEQQEKHPEVLQMDYMARCYGYQSAEEAEQRLRQSRSQSI